MSVVGSELYRCVQEPNAKRELHLPRDHERYTTSNDRCTQAPTHCLDHCSSMCVYHLPKLQLA
jgi:hypothetical protein